MRRTKKRTCKKKDIEIAFDFARYLIDNPDEIELTLENSEITFFEKSDVLPKKILHPAEIRLISYEQLYSEYEKTMLKLISVNEALLKERNYHSQPNITHPNKTYLNCQSKKRDDVCINNMRNEVYTNSHKLLYILSRILPLVCRY